jgi:hypothetical protein
MLLGALTANFFALAVISSMLAAIFSASTAPAILTMMREPNLVGSLLNFVLWAVFLFFRVWLYYSLRFSWDDEI